MIQQATFMNDTQIDRARKEGELVICPYNENNLTPVGYNLSFSRFIVSLRKQAFVKIKHKGDEWFFVLKPNETVAVLTRESIWVSKFIGGTFHSKVSLVTEGLGHVSTTLDPGWHGQLLVPINNPTRENIKVIIAYDREGKKEFTTFITMVLFRSQEASLNIKTDNKAARVELLEQILDKKKRNKDAKYLRDFIGEVKVSVDKMTSFDDLNDPADRRYKIIQFQREHLKLIAKMDAQFERLNKLSVKWYNEKRFVFYFVVIFIITILCCSIICVYTIDKLTLYQPIVSNCVAVLSAFLVLVVDKIYDKYI